MNITQQFGKTQQRLIFLRKLEKFELPHTRAHTPAIWQMLSVCENSRPTRLIKSFYPQTDYQKHLFQ